jgi:hypothetical protein
MHEDFKNGGRVKLFNCGHFVEIPVTPLAAPGHPGESPGGVLSDYGVGGGG